MPCPLASSCPFMLLRVCAACDLTTLLPCCSAAVRGPRRDNDEMPSASDVRSIPSIGEAAPDKTMVLGVACITLATFATCHHAGQDHVKRGGRCLLAQQLQHVFVPRSFRSDEKLHTCVTVGALSRGCLVPYVENPWTTDLYDAPSCGDWRPFVELYKLLAAGS